MGFFGDLTDRLGLTNGTGKVSEWNHATAPPAAASTMGRNVGSAVGHLLAASAPPPGPQVGPRPVATSAADVLGGSITSIEHMNQPAPPPRPLTLSEQIRAGLDPLYAQGAAQDAVLDAEYARRRDELGKLFNLSGEDPNARARLNAGFAGLNNQYNAAVGSIRKSYDQGAQALRSAGAQALTQGQANGAALAGIYNTQAADIAAGNSALGAQYADAFSGIGAQGPVQGQAVDAAALALAQAPVEAAAANANAQNWSGLNQTQAAQTGQYAASEQAQTTRDLNGYRMKLQSEFADAENQRRAREQDQYFNQAARLSDEYAKQHGEQQRTADSLYADLLGKTIQSKLATALSGGTTGSTFNSPQSDKAAFDAYSGDPNKYEQGTIPGQNGNPSISFNAAQAAAAYDAAKVAATNAALSGGAEGAQRAAFSDELLKRGLTPGDLGKFGINVNLATAL